MSQDNDLEQRLFLGHIAAAFLFYLSTLKESKKIKAKLDAEEAGIKK